MEEETGDFEAEKSLRRTGLGVWPVSQDKLMQIQRGRPYDGRQGAIKKKMPEVKSNEKSEDENWRMSNMFGSLWD